MALPRNSLNLSQNAYQATQILGGEGVFIRDSELKDGELASRQFVTLVDVIAEGQIAGFPSAIDAGLTHGTIRYRIAAL